MNVLIVENEVYLAKSISAKLSELNYTCHIVSSANEALLDANYDVVLLSTNILGQNIIPVIKKHSESIIILMISYISNDTVLFPLKAGADDYIQKPFIIEELIRKLEHFKSYKSLFQENRTCKEYIKHHFEDVPEFEIDKKITFPMLLRTNLQKYADSYMFKLSEKLKKNFQIISLSHPNSIKKLLQLPKDTTIYLVNLQHIKKSDKIKLIELIKDRQVVISSTNVQEEVPFRTIDLQTDNNTFSSDNILSLENYVRYVILNFQSKFPDTELSKKLGISRKSLWERRKKYGIIKEK